VDTLYRTRARPSSVSMEFPTVREVVVVIDERPVPSSSVLAILSVSTSGRSCSERGLLIAKAPGTEGK